MKLERSLLDFCHLTIFSNIMNLSVKLDQRRLRKLKVNKKSSNLQCDVQEIIVGIFLSLETILNLIPLITTYIVKFIYSEKATKFCEISTLLLTALHTVKSNYTICVFVEDFFH